MTIRLNRMASLQIYSTITVYSSVVQFNSKFFATLSSFLGVKHFITTAYHPPTNGQTESYNKKILTHSRHYVAKYKNDWDTFVHLLTFAYHTQVHRSTYQIPYDLVLRRHLSGPTLLRANNVVPTEA